MKKCRPILSFVIICKIYHSRINLHFPCLSICYYKCRKHIRKIQHRHFFFGTVASTIYDKTFKTAILIPKYLISYCGNSAFRERVRTAVRFATARRRRHPRPDFTPGLHGRRNRRRGTQKTGPQIRPGTHIRQRFSHSEERQCGHRHDGPPKRAPFFRGHQSGKGLRAFQPAKKSEP